MNTLEITLEIEVRDERKKREKLNMRENGAIGEKAKETDE